jgi:sulfite reductase (NADPH) flavoprotein alpha-component
MTMTLLPESWANELVPKLDQLAISELAWLSGYAAGLVRARQAATALLPNASATSQSPRATIIYGTSTGNSRHVAERIAQRLQQHGLLHRVVRAADYAVRELASEQVLFLVVATHGEGDPSDDTRELFDFVMGRRAPKLTTTSFAVMGLGDSSYAKFCHVARLLDEKFEQLGGKRLLARAECDVDFDTVAVPWIEQLLGKYAESPPSVIQQSIAAIAPVDSVATKHSPGTAVVLSTQQITARDADKRVMHVELQADAAKFRYQPGDSIAIAPRNPAWLVAQVAATLSLQLDDEVSLHETSAPLATWLTKDLELTRLARAVVVAAVSASAPAALGSLLEPGREAELSEFLRGHQVLDLLQTLRPSWNATQLVAALRPIATRSYSIASSPLAHPGEIHLTVAQVAFATAQGANRVGAASDFLATINIDDDVHAFIEPNDGFRLPDSQRDIIMVGPGTGVAPFRSFVQHRAMVGANGRNWLFFGERHQRSHFLYQLEWQAAVKRGDLHRIDLAFSRDRADKVYVQHRMIERGAELFSWLSQGAHFYVCGDAKHMAPDVERALLTIAKQHGAMSDDNAQQWLADLRSERRYHRDVY